VSSQSEPPSSAGIEEGRCHVLLFAEARAQHGLSEALRQRKSASIFLCLSFSSAESDMLLVWRHLSSKQPQGTFRREEIQSIKSPFL
jgi:hypothetical protein